MEKIRNLSLRKSIVLYVGAAITISFLLSVVCMWSVENVQQNIWRRYSSSQDDVEKAEDLDTEDQIHNFSRKVQRVPERKMSSKHAVLSNLCDFADTWCILIITMTDCILAVCLFYRNKIKRPLELLEESSRRISNQQLDFRISYNRKDEMGRLCAEFEKMRGELENNNKKMWRMIEQERILRAAVTHDIRSPLAIIKGYQETLKVFLPTGKLDEDKMLEIADSCLKQVERLDKFTETMKQLSKVEEREIVRKTVSLEDLVEHFREITHFLNSSGEIVCTFSIDGGGILDADGDIVCEVYENILSNALRYAKKKVDIVIKREEVFLEICVKDDGDGFGEDVKEAVKAYYRGSSDDEEIHFGLGLYICDVYCKKHGGYLQLENRKGGGACVNAMFQVG